jgi:flagellar biogenesis protein FliO
MFSANPVISTLLALGITLALIWLAAKLLMIISRNTPLPGIVSRRTSSNSTILTIESVIPIAPRRKIIVLRYGEARLAVLTGGPQDISLGWLPPPSSSPLP